MRLIPTFIVFLLAAAIRCMTCDAAQIKEPAVAGSFYPADAAALRSSVDRYLSSASRSADRQRPMALIVPHAGHQYSGAIAAEGYARLKGRPISTVIMIGPSHHVHLKGVAVYPGDGMRTPLGVVPVDVKTARSLVSPADDIRPDAAPFAREHSLEVQLPFIQRAFGGKVSVVPLLVGSPTQASLASLSAALGRILRNDPHALLVISTDLSHYHDQTTALAMDRRMIDAMERLSARDLELYLRSGTGEMCGAWPTVYGISAARAAGATHAVRYRSATSGDVTGDRKSVVGYAAMGIMRGGLSARQKRQLLDLAATALYRHVTGDPLPDSSTADPVLKADGATFVTLNDANGNLRGCIGTILPQMSLYASVVSNAVSAASRDSRFPPVRREELAGLRVEVTVLSPMEAVPDTKSIVIGKHGLYLEKDGRSSVFLPQVPLEQHWDLPTYLSQLAIKAGLPPDGWQGARLSVFTAEVIK
jgi:hypothetical protein